MLRVPPANVRREPRGAGSRPAPARGALARVLVVALPLAVVGVASGYLELRGMRILDPELRLGEAWGRGFVLGALRTASGAAMAGALVLGAGLLLPPSRGWTRRRWVRVWSAGAAVFLAALAGLVAWAP